MYRERLRAILTPAERKIFSKLTTPQKIQDYLNKLPFNFREGCVFSSPREVIKRGTVDCLEGALLASAILEFHRHKPLVIDLRSSAKPFDYDQYEGEIWEDYLKELSFVKGRKSPHQVKLIIPKPIHIFIKVTKGKEINNYMEYVDLRYGGHVYLGITEQNSKDGQKES